MIQQLENTIRSLTRTRKQNSDKPTRSIAGIDAETVTRLKVLASRHDVSIGQLAELAIGMFCDACEREGL
jgi:hypothetical protein